MLQEVEVSADFFPKGVTDKGYLIRSESDFCSYFKIEEEKLIHDFKTAVDENMPVSRWDHIYGLLGFSTKTAQITGEAPLLVADKILSQKQSDMLEMLSQGKSIFVNKMGGYHEFTDETHKIVEQKDYIFNKEDFINIAENPSLINLENDPVLEKHTLQYFKERELEVSSIINLKRFHKEDLVKIFNDFADKGGYGVYVYTTGAGVDQMREYIDAVIESKLNELTIELNSTVSSLARPHFKHAKNNIENFTLNDLTGDSIYASF